MRSHGLQRISRSRDSPGAGAAAATNAPEGVELARGLVRIVELLRTCVPTKNAGPGAGASPEAGVGLAVDTAKHRTT